MGKFLQLHLLHSYGPSNLNRDDSGRPKTATVGGVNRLRVSSQSLKRAWRTSEVFEKTVGNHIGLRTRKIGEKIIEHLREKLGNKFDEKKAAEVSKAVTKLWAAKDSKSNKDVLFLFSRKEYDATLAVAEKLAKGEIKDIAYTDILNPEDQDIDVALWGRMLAAKPEYNVVAACQVSHAITTHRADAEDDYFAACDDLGHATSEAGSGAGHIDARQFGAGIFYSYVCVDLDLLSSNLNGRTNLADAALEGIIRAAATVSPGGMQASFASRSFAQFVLAEIGSQQPRSLASAFTKPVWGHDQVAASVAAVKSHRNRLTAAYGPGCDAEAVLDISGEVADGSLTDIIQLARGQLSCVS